LVFFLLAIFLTSLLLATPISPPLSSHVASFSHSSLAGLVFNALVHKMRPKLVDYASLSEEKDKTPESGFAG
jgi:hypothetical protein